jgi:frataxin
MLTRSPFSSSAAVNRCVREMDESDFDRRADELLEDMMDALEALEETAGPAFELDYAMGVLTMILDENTTYVLNKQRPNRQVWMSSPQSGPRRFELDESGEIWQDVRSGENVLNVMQAELKEIAPEVALDLKSIN